MSETASVTGQKSQESGIQSVPGAQGTTQAHTSGPWTYRRGRTHFHVSGPRTYVAQVPYVKRPDGSTSEDFARLIAAAPGLLEALRSLRAACEVAYQHGMIESYAFIAAANVIAKAEGR